MGEERDKLIRRLGGTPLSHEKLADAELMARRMESYARKGQLPPEIQVLRDRSPGEAPSSAAGPGPVEEREGEAEDRTLLVGYGTLLNRGSMGKTVGGSAQEKPLIPVVVPGFRRLFNLVPESYEPSFKLREDPVEVAAANVQKAEGQVFNGLAFPVTAEELVALDRRERYYRRLEAEVLSFPEEEPLGRAYLYSASEDSIWVRPGDEDLLPRWKDVVLAREGAYAVSEAFGGMFDRTTFLADGRTPYLDIYRGDLPTLGDGTDA